MDTRRHRDPSTHDLSRRGVLAAGLTAAIAGTLGASPRTLWAAGQPPMNTPDPKAQPITGPDSIFTISLAQWSLHRSIRSGTLSHLDFPRSAKKDYGIDAVEYVSTLFMKKGDDAYTRELKTRCDDLGVRSLLIMVDAEGDLGDPDEQARARAVENHQKWLLAAKTLGCHSIRVNAASRGKPEEQQQLAADGLRALCRRADPLGLNVIVENHGGFSSRGDWLVGVMKLVAHPRIGTLPDFGNFADKDYDRYKGIAEMMPWARGVSAKSWDFDDATGDHVGFDFRRMLRIVFDAGYRGRIGIEYEGNRLPEPEGIRATKRLLEKLRDETLAEKTEGP